MLSLPWDIMRRSCRTLFSIECLQKPAGSANSGYRHSSAPLTVVSALQRWRPLRNGRDIGDVRSARAAEENDLAKAGRELRGTFDCDGGKSGGLDDRRTHLPSVMAATWAFISGRVRSHAGRRRPEPARGGGRTGRCR